MPRSGSVKKQAMAGDANDALPRDVLASVLLRFPASDLRRFRRVCKEWFEVISDPAFIHTHMVHGPRALTHTHTIVFFRGRSGGGADGAIEPRSSDGYLFNEQWRLVARFTAGESENMVGTCNGLLCFVDSRQGGVRVVEPFTGESLVLPPPPPVAQRLNERTRGESFFGFDPSSRRYKILYQEKDHYYVCTIGGGENCWRRARAAAVPYDHPVFADGSACSIATNRRKRLGVVRFHLATEEITSEPIELADSGTALSGMTTVSEARVYVMGIGRHGEMEMFFMRDGGRWARYSIAVRAPDMRFPAWPHPLQRGHLLLHDCNADSRRGVYAHRFPPAVSNDLGSGRLLLQMPRDWPGADGTPRCDNNTRWLFVPVPCEEEAAARVRRVPQEHILPRVFSYAPPVSPPPLARYFGGLPKI